MAFLGPDDRNNSERITARVTRTALNLCLSRSCGDPTGGVSSRSADLPVRDTRKLEWLKLTIWAESLWCEVEGLRIGSEGSLS